MPLAPYGSIAGLREAPLDVSGLLVFDARDAKSIKRGGAIVEKENVRTRVLCVARIDALVLAVVDAIPTIDMIGVARFFRRRRPGFGPFGIVPAGRIEPVNIRKA